MPQTESLPSLITPKPNSNETIFSVTTNAAVNNVIDIADARATLAQANSSSQGLSAWALDIARKITGTEPSKRVQQYADLVSLRARAVALSSTTIDEGHSPLSTPLKKAA